MSHKRVEGRCFVVDASVARAAGGPDTSHPTGKQCREFLQAIKSICHRVAWGKRVREEWRRHASTFAAQWEVAMRNLRKLRLEVDDSPVELCERIAESAPSPEIASIIAKDAHLVAAALATDSRIASLDDQVRGHLASLVNTLESLRGLHWVNPTRDAEGILQWLESGAPDRAAFRIDRQ